MSTSCSLQFCIGISYAFNKLIAFLFQPSDFVLTPFDFSLILSLVPGCVILYYDGIHDDLQNVSRS